MKNMLRKSTLREIKNSFSRWLAILAIVALGVGFFSGLKVTKETFLVTGDDFLSACNFFDYELISTLGIEEDDVKKIADIDGVKDAEGSYSSDALFVILDENMNEAVVEVDTDTAAAPDSNDLALGDKVGKIHTITDKINKVKLEAGRMPERSDECLVDYNRFSKGQLGDYIRFSEANDSETLEKFTTDTFKIVGIVSSPLYLNFERGSTSLGDGQVNSYIYLPEEAWDMEVFTEVYLTMENGGFLYSDEYNANRDALEEPLTEAFEKLADERYERILKDADEEISDAEKKLEDAKKELKDGRKELRDGEDEIADAKEELSKAQEKLRDGAREIISNEKKLRDARKELEDGKKAYKEGFAALKEGKAELKAARDKYEAGLAEFEAGRAGAYAQLAPLEAALAKAEGTPYYDMYAAQYEAAKAQIDSTLEAPFKELENARIQLEAGEAELKAKEAELSAAGKEIEKTEKMLDKGEEELDEARGELTRGREEYAEAEKEVADGERELEDAEKEISDGEKEVADAEKELADAKKELSELEPPDTYVLNRSTNIGYACFDSDSSIVESVAKVFPIFFFIVAALVVMTTMSRMVDEQRTQIGVLKALGYSKYKILGKYVFYSGSAALTGGAAGFLVGSYLFPWVIWYAYGMMYGFAEMIPVYNWKLGATVVLCAVICVLGATFYSCYREFMQQPAELIRPKAPEVGKRILLERVGFIWKKMKFLHKVSARNIFRYKKRFFMMVAGICGCTALLVTGFGISDSITNVVDVQYDEIFKVDYTVTFADKLDREGEQMFAADNADKVSGALFCYAISADVHTDERTKSVNLVVCSRDDEDVINSGKFISLHDGNDETVRYPGKGECIINSSFAERMGINVGDELLVTDNKMNSMTVKVSDICINYVYNYMYVNSETYEEQVGEYLANSAYVKGTPGSDGVTVDDPSADGAALMNADNVAAVSITKDFRERVSNMMQAMNYVVALVIASAGALAFIVLYNLTNINITERIREIATIKVLGFYPKEAAAYVFRENFVLTAVSALIGLPLGTWLHHFVMGEIKIDVISFDVRIAFISYLISFVMTFVFAMIVNFVMYFRISNINMAESLKSIE